MGRWGPKLCSFVGLEDIDFGDRATETRSHGGSVRGLLRTAKAVGSTKDILWIRNWIDKGARATYGHTTRGTRVVLYCHDLVRMSPIGRVRLNRHVIRYAVHSALLTHRYLSSTLEDASDEGTKERQRGEVKSENRYLA